MAKEYATSRQTLTITYPSAKWASLFERIGRLANTEMNRIEINFFVAGQNITQRVLLSILLLYVSSIFFSSTYGCGRAVACRTQPAHVRPLVHIVTHRVSLIDCFRGLFFLPPLFVMSSERLFV